jgi:hypothetical protein
MVNLKVIIATAINIWNSDITEIFLKYTITLTLISDPASHGCNADIKVFFYYITYIPLTLYPRRGSRGISDTPPRRPRFTKIYL